ncbi:uncharacterized protein LOC8034621 [Ixodes scapularis]|uniref:uncharacterized protein LOC8034621 n=1 Tax=Ixodes scapularis TaxID=6945 RepID=UPI001C3844BE|nr:uncharacterized protein LOC8034621 [Ixodes scapularis]
MPTGCSVLLCPNRTAQSPLVRAKKLQFHRLPREERLRSEWCGRIGRRDPGQADVRVCSEHFHSDRDYRRLPSVLRDAGQTMKNVYLKPDAIPSLRLPPTAKRLSPAKDPAVPTSKRRRTENDEPVEVDCFERTTPREHSCHCRHRPATRDTAVQADLHENPGPAQTPRPPGTKDSSVGTDRWLGKRSTGTQWNAYAKGITAHWVQTEDLETPDSSSTTAGSNSTTTAAAFASTTTTSAVPPRRPGPACAMSPVLSDSDEEEEEEEDDDDGDDCDDDPLWEPPTKGGFVESATTVSGEPDYKERKFLVFESSLRQLFAVCQTCYSPCSVSLSTIGTLLTVHTSCPAGHKNRWDSQPYINGRPLGNLLITSFVLFTGASPTITLRLLRLMNIVVISMKTYTNYQRAILIPAVEQVWEEEQEKLLGELRDQPLDLAGDGRCDSPGYSAKYLTYSLHAPHVNKIVHLEQVQVGECEAVPNSGSMEKEGLIRSLAFAREKELTVRSLATDRHRSIAKHMREKEPAVLHFFDVWHVSKSVKKSLNAASKSHDCGSLVGWAQPAVNHMYWCATASRGNPDLLVGAWSSMTRHVVDVHADHPGMYTKCLHEPIEDGEWLVPDTPAHARFVDVVSSKSLLKDLRQLSPDTQTYGLESFHSVLNRFAPKWAAFRTKGMLARTRVAALHWNENSEREQATTKAGERQWAVRSPKARKGHHTVCPQKTKVTYGILKEFYSVVFLIGIPVLLGDQFT